MLTHLLKARDALAREAGLLFDIWAQLHYGESIDPFKLEAARRRMVETDVCLAALNAYLDFLKHGGKS